MSVVPPNRVRVLDDVVVNQIAAGEVVERPASVVKELVENSVDAGATKIWITIANGGRSLIEITDNGCGMSRDDALLAVERFGTSKIRDVTDLQAVSTHGFRGEALPSIASVSRFTLETCLHGDLEAGAEASGTKLAIDGGILKNVTECRLRPGCRITVRQLFYNVPARRKFLRSENTEDGLVRALLTDFAVAYPQIAFTLIADGKEVIQYPAEAEFFTRVRQFSRQFGGANAVPICSTTKVGVFVIRAALSKPLENVSTGNRLRLLVNRRSVRDRLLLKAVRDGYGNLLRPGRYPTGFLMVELPPADVDVNVHPQKREVRFREPELVFRAVIQAVEEAIGREGRVPGAIAEHRSRLWLGQHEPRPEPIFVPGVPAKFAFASPDAASTPREESEVTEDHLALSARIPIREVGQPFEHLGLPKIRAGYAIADDRAQIDDEQATAVFDHMRFSDGHDNSVKRDISDASLSQMRFVGQVFACYLVLEGEGKMALVDMHAAHERVTFCRLKRELVAGEITSQLLLIPELIELPPDRIEAFERSQETLLRLGIDAEKFGQQSVVVRSLPAALSGIAAHGIIAELLALSEWGDWGHVVSGEWDHVIARLACHRSIRSGRVLKSDEVYALLHSLRDAELSGLCPHGRPTFKIISETELQSMFGRI